MLKMLKIKGKTGGKLKKQVPTCQKIEAIKRKIKTKIEEKKKKIKRKTNEEKIPDKMPEKNGLSQKLAERNSRS